MESTDTYRKNIEAARRFFPGMEQRIAGAEAGPDLLLEKAASGDPTARLDGRYLHSARDPAREAARLVSASFGEGFREDRAFLLLGFGLGYAAEAAEALDPPPLVIAVEKRTDVLRAAFETRDLTRLLGGRLVFVLGDEPDAVNGALAIAPKNLSVIKNPALIAADAAFYSEVERHIENWRTKDTVNEATLRRFGRRWVKNQAANLTAIRDLPGIGLLAGRFDFPALLLAAGPTLNELTGKTAALAGRCVVVAVDTALRFLKNEGIKPDFVVSVDPQYWNARHLDRCLPPGSALVTEAASYPATLRDRLSGDGGGDAMRSFLCGALYPLSVFIERRVDVKGRLGAGGSVASSAWDFALSLAPQNAARPVFIAGLDFAFPGLATHYRGALFEERAVAGATRFLPAETRSIQALLDGAPFFAQAADGTPVMTDKRLNLYASWFENRVKSSKGRDSARLSDRGLAINGMRTASIEEVLALPSRRPEISACIEQSLSEIFRKWNAETECASRAARYKAACASLFGGLEDALDAAKSVIPELAALAHSAGQEAALKRIDVVRDTLEKSEVKSAASFLCSRPGGWYESAGPPDRESCDQLIESIRFTLAALHGGARSVELERGNSQF